MLHGMAPPLCSSTFNAPVRRTNQYRCSRPGVLTKPTSEEDALTASCIAWSYANCRDNCLTYSSCKTFGYDETTGLCTSSLKRPKSQGFVAESTSPTVYTNHQCYTTSYLYQTDSFNFHQSHQGLQVTYFDSNGPLQPDFTTTLSNTFEDECGAVAACRAYSRTLPNGNTPLIDVEYLESAASWTCLVTFGTRSTVSRQYITPDNDVVKVFGFRSQQK